MEFMLEENPEERVEDDARVECVFTFDAAEVAFLEEEETRNELWEELSLKYAVPVELLPHSLERLRSAELHSMLGRRVKYMEYLKSKNVPIARNARASEIVRVTIIQRLRDRGFQVPDTLTESQARIFASEAEAQRVKAYKNA